MIHGRDDDAQRVRPRVVQKFIQIRVGRNAEIFSHAGGALLVHVNDTDELRPEYLRINTRVMHAKVPHTHNSDSDFVHQTVALPFDARLIFHINILTARGQFVAYAGENFFLIKFMSFAK